MLARFVSVACSPAFFVGLGTSCASYTERTSGALHDFRGGHFDSALQAYADVDEIGSSFLSGAEAGTVALTAGSWEAAIHQFGLAAQAVRELEDRALTGELGEVLASWALNDTARAYEGEGFERVYLHCGLAMAYLAKGKIDDVYVEARLANRLLESEERLYETKYEAGGWGHLISAVTYELIGDKDDAYIDYQRMLEKGVGTALAGRALVRLAKELGRQEELPALEQAHGVDTPRPEGAANIVVLAAVGLGPYKEETVLPVPTPDGLFQMAVPGYVQRPQPVSALRLIEGASGEAVRTDQIESVTQIAKDNLEDRLLWIAAKSVARGLLKRELTKELEKEYDVAGRVAGDLFTFFSERADLRAWLTLPDSYQACRMFVPPGVHRLTLEAVGGESVELGSFELDPGETMLVFARSLDARLYAHPIGGKLAGPTTGDASETMETRTP